MSVVLDTTAAPARLASYVALTRPRVIALVTATAVPVLALERPGIAVAALALAGTALCGAACSALNAVLERDLDARMARTRGRPLPSGALTPGQATAFGLALSAVSTILLYALDPLAAIVGAGTIAFYVGVYTAHLKRTTPQNIVIGGAAGATAPLIADAVDGGIGPVSLLLAFVIFAWTPAHFWAIALFRREEYANAGVPMLPIVLGDGPTRLRMLAYGALAVLLALHPALLRAFGAVYGASAVALGAFFLWMLVALWKQGTRSAARRAFHASNAWLLLLFAAMLAGAAVSE
jgi:protoheme IX farnesyltransferase